MVCRGNEQNGWFGRAGDLGRSAVEVVAPNEEGPSGEAPEADGVHFEQRAFPASGDEGGRDEEGGYAQSHAVIRRYKALSPTSVSFLRVPVRAHK